MWLFSCVWEDSMVWWWGSRRPTLVTDGTRQCLLFMQLMLCRVIKFMMCCTLVFLLLRISPRCRLVMNNHGCCLQVFSTIHIGNDSVTLFLYCVNCSFQCASNSVRCCQNASVCLSICLSVHQMCALWQNEKLFCLHSYTIWKIDSSSFMTQRMVCGGRPLYVKLWTMLTSFLQKCLFSIDIHS